jgi:hypothetical protein
VAKRKKKNLKKNLQGVKTKSPQQGSKDSSSTRVKPQGTHNAARDAQLMAKIGFPVTVMRGPVFGNPGSKRQKGKKRKK